MNEVEKQYSELKDNYQATIERQTQTINLISNIRLITFLSTLGFGIYFIVKKNYGWLGWDFGVFLVLFIPLIILHDNYFNRRKYAIILRKINVDSLMRIRGEWNSFADDGAEFTDYNHNYSQDLDIFGQGSLFQFINTTVTFLGRQKLSDFLSAPARSCKEITERQEAVKELALKLTWRQKYQAEGLLQSAMQDPQPLFSWAEKIDNFYRDPRVIFIFRLIPAITIIIGIMTFINPVRSSYYILIAALVIQSVILKIKAKSREEIFGIARKFMQNIKAYHKMLDLLEQEDFSSRHLQELKPQLTSNGLSAGEQIRGLEKIVDSIANRQNLFYIFFNILFLMDYQFVFALEKWKKQSGQHLPTWLKIVAEFEVLSSLAVLSHDYPEWTTPDLSAEGPIFETEMMRHPLLMDAGIPNDLRFESPQNILLITGSNMSGKSTMLRTAGINLVLAYAGGNVAAKKFRCSIMNIYTCMRVSDNLEQNISSFYAELLRIKMIVTAVEAGQTVFFLLDEIFKGTNSIDRHTGARVLIKKLSNARILGLVSTHDLELGDLEKESNKIKNYHFEEYYENNQIRFDYKLRPGISTTRNAAYLMQLAGIDFGETEIKEGN